MKYFTRLPIGISEVTEEAYEASLTESIALIDYGWDKFKFKNCKGLLSLNNTNSGRNQATIKDMDGILKRIEYFSSDGVSLLKEVMAWSESSMLSRMGEKITELEASLADTKNLLAEAKSRNSEYYGQVDSLQMDNAVKTFLLKVSRKNWKNKAICENREDNSLILYSCIAKNCEGCDRSPLGKVSDYL